MWATAVINFKCCPVIIIKLYSLQKPLCTSSKELLCIIDFGVAGRNSKHLHINYILVMVCSSTLALQAQAPPPRMQLLAIKQPLCPIFSAHLFCFLSSPRRFPEGHQQRSWGSSPPIPTEIPSEAHPLCALQEHLAPGP